VAKYIIRFQANPEAWPADPAEVLALWEDVIGSGNALLEDGSVAEINWTSDLAGYAIMEAASKDAVRDVTAPFSPSFNQEIDEAVPWAEATSAILDRAKAAAGATQRPKRQFRQWTANPVKSFWSDEAEGGGAERSRR